MRPEIMTRSEFARKRGLELFERMKNAEKGAGNIMGCKWIDKLAQARRIYKHYNTEFCNSLK